MALLSFPPSPIAGQLYPTSPLVGQSQYQWDSTDNTWKLQGTATGVIPGCYGDAYTVPSFCVDAVGRITFAGNVAIAATTPDLQQVTTQGAVTTDVIDVGGIIAAGLTYPVADGAAGEVLTTDGAGNLGWVAAATVVAAPTASGDFGNPGEIAYDSTYFYWFDGGNWQRVAADMTPW